MNELKLSCRKRFVTNVIVISLVLGLLLSCIDVFATIPGDIDADGDVDPDDFALFAAAYGTSPPSNPCCDLDNDGDVDSDDFALFAGNYGSSIVSPLNDNFNDNEKSDAWLIFIAPEGQGEVSEVNQHLECASTPMFECNVGYVTAYRYNFTERYAQIEVTQLANLETMNIGISPILDTEEMFYHNSEMYQFYKNRPGASIVVRRRLPGQGVEYLKTRAWASATGTLKIELKSDGKIYFYENSVEVYNQAYALTTPEVYVYIWGNAWSAAGFTGTDYFDNFQSNLSLSID